MLAIIQTMNFKRALFLITSILLLGYLAFVFLSFGLIIFSTALSDRIISIVSILAGIASLLSVPYAIRFSKKFKK